MTSVEKPLLENMALNNIKCGQEYSREELTAWFETRSRICATPLWLKALQGKAVFEVGDYTYNIKPTASGHYLVNAKYTAELIKPRDRSINYRKIILYFALTISLGGVCVALLSMLKP